MEFKYQKEISKFEDCKIKELIKFNGIGFRIVTEPLNENSFKPTAFVSGKPILSCEAYALSFYNTYENCKSNLNKLLSKKPSLEKKIGNKIAKCNLEEQDGLSDKINNKGHFNFFEFKNANISLKSVLIN